MRVVPDGQRLDHAGLAGGLPVELEEGAAVAAGRRRDARPCRTASGCRSRGRGRAGRFRPGRRGCGRAGRRRRRGARRRRPGRRSGRRGRRLRGRRRGRRSRRRTRRGRGRRPRRRWATSAARRSEPGWRPWSTVTPPARMAELGGLEGEGGGEGHGVGAAGAGHEHEGAASHGGRSRGAGAEPGVPACEAARWRRCRGCSVRTSWSTRRTARRIAATAGWGPMSVSLREVGGASVTESSDGDSVTQSVSMVTEPSRSPSIARLPIASRSLGRVINGAFVCRRPELDPVLTTPPCGAPARPSPPVWRSPPWSGGCSATSRPG